MYVCMYARKYSHTYKHIRTYTNTIWDIYAKEKLDLDLFILCFETGEKKAAYYNLKILERDLSDSKNIGLAGNQTSTKTSNCSYTPSSINS